MIKVTAFLYIVAKCKQNIHCYFVDCFRKSRANNPEGRHGAGSAYVN